MDELNVKMLADTLAKMSERVHYAEGTAEANIKRADVLEDIAAQLAKIAKSLRTIEQYVENGCKW